jgi:hypothetical protein
VVGNGGKATGIEETFWASTMRAVTPLVVPPPSPSPSSSPSSPSPSLVTATREPLHGTLFALDPNVLVTNEVPQPLVLAKPSWVILICTGRGARDRTGRS